MPTNSEIIKGFNKKHFKKIKGGNLILTTPGERMLLSRTRAGQTLKQRRAELNNSIGLDRMRAMEWDEDRYFRKLPIRPSDLQEITVTDGEFCWLQRRRRDWGSDEAGAAMGVSRMTISNAEHDRTSGVKDIKRWYLRHGFIEAQANVPEDFEGEVK